VSRGTVTAVVRGWVASRVLLAVTMVTVGWWLQFDLAQRQAAPWQWAVARFTWSDSFHYLRIARVGYLPPELPCCDQAFFPGYPLLLALARPLAGGDLPLAGVLVSLVASTVAAVGLWRLAANVAAERAVVERAAVERAAAEGAAAESAAADAVPAQVGWTAVGLLALAPYGVFLTSVFTESTFLACAVWAWWCARTGRWWWAGALAGAASLVRVNGLFLAVGLAVLYLMQSRRQGSGLGLRWVGLLASPAAFGAYVTYLWTRTGSWTEWSQAQTIGWDRRVAWPWIGVTNTWRAMLSPGVTDLPLTHAVDLGATALCLALLVELVRRRWWGEAAYLGLNAAVLVCSTTLQSAGRYALLWFPGYVVGAMLAVRWWRSEQHRSERHPAEEPRAERHRSDVRRSVRRRSVVPVVVVLAALTLAELGVAVMMAAHVWIA
jgi:hypothetical protein